MSMGMAVAGKAIDVITNNTDQYATYVYEARGYIENNQKDRDIYFGMWASPPADNYNWGRGTMFITAYLKVLE